MGKMKNDYIEDALPPQRWVSNIHFICPDCDHENNQEIVVPEPNYMAEKSRDMTVEGDLEIHCDNCESYHEAEVWAGPAHCEITFRKHSNIAVNCDTPGYDRPPEDWFDIWSTPEEPTQIFHNNYHSLRDIIEKHAKEDGSSLMNRMIFAQILTFLEAYFCDTLIIGLRKYPERMAKFTERDGASREAEIPISTMLRDPDAALKWVEMNLRDRLYHQFGSGIKDKKNGKEKISGVPLWYRTAFDISLTPKEEDLTTLRTYARLRHDCVHRNGETKQGLKLDMFDKNYLLNALALAKSTVDHIDTELSVLDGTYVPF